MADLAKERLDLFDPESAYSGAVFQIELPGQGVAGQVAGGGRYDGLLASIGGPADTPAVGFSIHTERLLAARGGVI